MTKAEHLDWCKQRAFQYLDLNDPTNAIASFMSDLAKHNETINHPLLPSIRLIMDSTNIEAVRKCINKFN